MRAVMAIILLVVSIPLMIVVAAVFACMMTVAALWNIASGDEEPESSRD